jgi:predicted MPP superfamily phosphohydrolase
MDLLLKLDARGKKVLFISDTHIPYSIKGYIDFLKDLKQRIKPDIVIHVGDELDYHAISFHDSDSGLLSADQELDNSIIEIQEGLHKLFPKMYLLESNHGSLIFRKIKHHGLPVRLVKPLHELYETPLWSWHNSILLKTNRGPVYICHGKTSSYGKMVKEYGVSCVQGHFHSKFEITYHKTVMGKRFNMMIGCLADQDSMAMAYAKNNVGEFINGTAYLRASGEPVLVPFYGESKPKILASHLEIVS